MLRESVSLESNSIVNGKWIWDWVFSWNLTWPSISSWKTNEYWIYSFISQWNLFSIYYFLEEPWCGKLSKKEPSGHPRLWSPTLSWYILKMNYTLCNKYLTIFFSSQMMYTWNIDITKILVTLIIYIYIYIYIYSDTFMKTSCVFVSFLSLLSITDIAVIGNYATLPCNNS